LIVDHDEAIALLADVADVWLLHDREIVARADDYHAGRARWRPRLRRRRPAPMRAGRRFSLVPRGPVNSKFQHG
jgi:hydrogenase maturation factor HypF (carbamoyltransferase family)